MQTSQSASTGFDRDQVSCGELVKAERDVGEEGRAHVGEEEATEHTRGAQRRDQGGQTKARNQQCIDTSEYCSDDCRQNKGNPEAVGI